MGYRALAMVSQMVVIDWVPYLVAAGIALAAGLGVATFAWILTAPVWRRSAARCHEDDSNK